MTDSQILQISTMMKSDFSLELKTYVAQTYRLAVYYNTFASFRPKYYLIIR